MKVIEALVHKYGEIPGITVKGNKIEEWPEKELGKPPSEKEIKSLVEEYEAFEKTKEYGPKRKERILAKYSVEDQLDIFLKVLVQLRMNGTDLPQEADDLIGHWTNVKKEIPKGALK